MQAARFFGQGEGGAGSVAAMTKRKPKKPYTVEWRAKDGQLFRDWSVYSRYKTEKDRDKGLRALSCSGHPMFEFRAGNPRPPLEEAQPLT